MLLGEREAKVAALEGQVASMQSIVQYSKQELSLRARDAAELTQVKQELMTKEQKVREMKQLVSGGGQQWGDGAGRREFGGAAGWPWPTGPPYENA